MSSKSTSTEHASTAGGLVLAKSTTLNIIENQLPRKKSTKLVIQSPTAAQVTQADRKFTSSPTSPLERLQEQSQEQSDSFSIVSTLSLPQLNATFEMEDLSTAISECESRRENLQDFDDYSSSDGSMLDFDLEELDCSDFHDLSCVGTLVREESLGAKRERDLVVDEL